MSLNQNDLEYLQDMIQRGKMTADQANVEMVRMARIRIVVCSISAQTRKALNVAVKAGELGHMKKDGRKPEVYFHPNFENLANQERKRIEKETIESLAAVLCRAADL